MIPPSIAGRKPTRAASVRCMEVNAPVRTRARPQADENWVQSLSRVTRCRGAAGAYGSWVGAANQGHSAMESGMPRMCTALSDGPPLDPIAGSSADLGREGCIASHTSLQREERIVVRNFPRQASLPEERAIEAKVSGVSNLAHDIPGDVGVLLEVLLDSHPLTQSLDIGHGP